ncbi:serine-rich adhesin for platelets-like [Ambystoma mexicanum]|uniref:serine-rich adhesin for platelets-like n=1 Tax=Ambystoma mexicanum TaxID=8296 RepID=UPI0037E723D9
MTLEDFPALLGSLSRTCQELEEIKQEQAKDYKRISRSFEQALLAILRQEQSIMKQVEQEHGQLRAKLTSLQRVNEQALQECVCEINRMVQQIAKVSAQLQSFNGSKGNTATMKDLQVNIAEIFARKKSIIIRLKKVEFSPCQLQIPALGEVHYEEQTFGFSIPYLEARGSKSANRTASTNTPLLSEEPPPWDITSSDSGSTDNGGISNSKKGSIGGDTDSRENGRKTSRQDFIQKRPSRESISDTSEETVVISPRTSLSSDTETKALSPRTVNKIRISDTESSSSTPNSEENVANSNGGSTDSKEERTIGKRGPSFPQHLSEQSLLGETFQSATRAGSSHLPRGKSHTLGGNVQGRKSTVRMESQHPHCTQTVSSNAKLHTLDNTWKNASIDSNHIHMKKNTNGSGVSSPNTNDLQSSNTLEGKPLLCLEKDHVYPVNYSKASKTDNELHSIDLTEPRDGEITANIAKLKAQNHCVQPLSITTEKQDGKSLHGMSPSLALVLNQDSVFRATTAFVYEDDSDNSDDGPDGKRVNDGEKDPKACRVVAIRASRVPSAKKIGSLEQLSKWNSMELVSNVEIASPVETPTYDLTESPTRLSDPIPFQPNLYGQCCADPSTQKKMALGPQPTDQLKSFEIFSSPTGDQNSILTERSPSPTESMKSSYTFIIESPRNDSSRTSGFGTSERKRLPPTPNQSARRGRPVISSFIEPKKDKTPPQSSRKKQLDRTLSEGSNIQRSGAPLVSNKKDQFANFNRVSGSKAQDHNPQCTPRKPVGRSTSMPVIDNIPKSRSGSSNAVGSQFMNDRRDSAASSVSSKSNLRPSSKSTPPRAVKSAISRGKASQYGKGKNQSSESGQQHLQRTRGLSKSESNLIGHPIEEDKGPYTNKLIGQFSKFGSGRGELNLPHGIHTTLMGALYVVDYGNRRVQVMDCKGCILQQITLEAKNYFDIAVNNKGLVALTNSSDKTVEVYSKHGKLLQVFSKNLNTPRGIASNFRDEFVIADMKLGTLSALTLDLNSGRPTESTIVPGFNKPYLVGANSQGLVAVSERGFDGGCCVKVLNDDWQVVRVLGLKGGPGPVLFNPWGVCVDNEGDILVADWGQTHSVIHYPTKGSPRAVVSDGLSSPRGLAVLQDHYLVAVDSMHNCIKIFQYK